MPVAHNKITTFEVIKFGGEVVGRILPRGVYYVVYTSHPTLVRLNGHRYGSLEAARKAVADRLNPPSQAVPAGYPRPLMTEEDIADLFDERTFEDNPRAH